MDTSKILCLIELLYRVKEPTRSCGWGVYPRKIMLACNVISVYSCTIMTKPTITEICSNYDLWETYVDPDGLDTEEAFNAMTLEDRLAFFDACFHYEIQDNKGVDDE